ncbi:asparagine synthase (glutamine-hydrolyzing) [Ferrovibrio sp.]|uniref:asparagine synthase (glutamine-hydrolyzing) n=1 Tax=Ferrovibrio sp. TaxID=1917215 RepID=UPI00311E1C66
MCGIAGILGTGNPETVDLVARMVRAQRHRGPDAEQVVQVPGGALGHGRLSVIDLSAAADQPMVDSSGRYVLVFNGEIYNYLELKQELARQYDFVTRTDSEVLLAALLTWGEQALERLNGMFAFCLYDTEARTALLGRDRFGQKPLHFAEIGGQLVFASEIKALLATGLIRAKPNRQVWARYLLHARYDDDGDTYFEGIRQLRPGDCARFSPGQALSIRRWYDIATRVHPRDYTAGAAAEEMRSLLVDAARVHMRSDVPVGVSLSGGLDSSALLACLDLSGELSDQVKCVSVDFGGDLSERPWMEAAAGHHGLATRILPYSAEDFRGHIRPMMWHLEGPIGGLMNCALAPVMRAAHADGIVVVQDGTGLDEAFGGYRNHHDLYLGLALRSGGPEADDALRGYCANWNCSADHARRAARSALDNTVSAIDGTVPVRPELLDRAFVGTHGAPLAPGPQTGDALIDGLATYLQVEKIPRNTRMKDRLSMAYSLELRLPFLDHRLVEFGLSLPPHLMFLHGRTKSIIREALAGAMDDNVRLAAKRSIQAPQGPWLMREPMRSYVRDLIGSDSFADRGMFDPGLCRQAFDRFCTGADANSFFVWQWINVEEWFRTFVDGDSVETSFPLDATMKKPMASRSSI